MNQEESNPREPDAGRKADERLIHALLLNLHDEHAVEHREQRVQRAMEALRGPAQPSLAARSSRPETTNRTYRFPVWGRRTIGIAAMLLIAASVWIMLYSPQPALASLNDILSSLGRPGDRTYHIQMEDLPEPPGKGPTDDQRPVPKPGLNDATLYLRDGRQYLLVRHDPNGRGPILDGYDGQQHWRVHGGILDDAQAGRGGGGIPMPALMADVPFSDLHQTLERIRVDYTTEQLDQARLTPGGETLRHVRVRRNSHDVKGPETIEIWADAKTAVPKRIIFDDAKLQGNRAPCRLTLDLVSEDSQAPNWFGPAAHTPPQTK